MRRFRGRAYGGGGHGEAFVDLAAGGPVRNALLNPSAYGWPDASNTGPTGLLTSSPGLTVSVDGAVVEGLAITGGITANANNVTVRRCWIRYTGTLYPIRQAAGRSGLIVEDVEIDGQGGAKIAVYSSGGAYALRRCDIHDVQDGPRIEQDDVLIEDCYVHDLTRISGGHHDVLQIRRGDRAVIRHNTLLAAKEMPAGHPDALLFPDGRWFDPMNAVLQYGSDTVAGDSYDDLVFEHNLVDGGNYTLNGPGAEDQRQRIVGNRFGRHYRYGVATSDIGPDDVWADNVWDDTGEPIAA